MPPLLPESVQLLKRLESMSGRRVKFVHRINLPVLASLQIARNGALNHLFQYRESHGQIDYPLCRQVGMVIRMFQLLPDDRMDFAGETRGENVFREMLSASTRLTDDDRDALPDFARMLNQWALMQIRSIPIGMRVDAWLYATFSGLRDLVAQGLEIEQQTNANILGRRVGNFTVPPSQLAPSAAYALFTDRLLGTSRYSIPFEAAGALSEGRDLLALFDTIADDSTFDRQLVDAWAQYLGMKGWYKWIPYEP